MWLIIGKKWIFDFPGWGSFCCIDHIKADQLIYELLKRPEMCRSQANKSPWLRLGGFLEGVEWHGADWLHLVSTYFFSWHWKLRCQKLRCKHLNKSPSMKGIHAVDSSNIMIDVVSYILKKMCFLFGLFQQRLIYCCTSLKFFLPLSTKSRSKDCAVCQLKIRIRNGDAAVKPVLFIQETLNHVVCMPAL